MTNRLDQLRSDWATHPGIKFLAFGTVEELDDHLRKCHEVLISPNSGPFGYLYQKQIARVRELKRRLENYERKREQPTGRGQSLRGRR